MVNGLELANETLRLMEESGFGQVVGFLEMLEQDYNKVVMSRRPEEILFD
jgi:hypothetical protein